MKIFLVCIQCLIVIFAAGEASATLLGLNKVELVQQYLGTASGGNGSAEYRKVTQAMARKSLDDARDVGAAFVRVAITGTMPFQPGQRSDIELWQKRPNEYWKLIDEMMNDLSSRNIRIVPVFVWGLGQFPVVAGERVDAMLRNQNSESWKLLEKYMRDFIARYKSHPSVLFYELGNEFNVSADLNLVKRCDEGAKVILCGAKANFTSDDIISFTKRMADVIRALDPSRKISTGYAVPRSSALHLKMRPEWTPRGPDWTLDSISELERYVAAMHQHVDIISVHLYPVNQNQRFGAGAGEEYRLLAVLKQIADRIGKPLFIGEFGDMDARGAGAGSFSDRLLSEIVRLQIPYAAMWGWQLYIKNTYTTYDSIHTLSSLEPGRSDYLISRFKQAAEGVGSRTVVPSVKALPRVVLTWPLECSKASNNQTVHAVASAAGGGPVQRVEFLVNGKLIESKTKPPYQTSLNSKDFSPGEYRIAARATDSSGKSAEYSATILINTQSVAAGVCAVKNR